MNAQIVAVLSGLTLLATPLAGQAPAAAEQEAEARNYAECRFAPVTPNHVLRRFMGIRFHLPPNYDHLMSLTETASNVRAWAASDSTVFFLGGEGAAVGYAADVMTNRSEAPCSLQVLGRTVRVDLELAHSTSHPDTMFMARVFFFLHDEIPATVAIFARSRDQRERLLGSVVDFAIDSR
jgi:hypothetical protein